jgi:hypothetical protein
MSILCLKFPSDLPGVNPATNDRMILYYCLMTKVDGLLGDSTVFFLGGLSQESRSLEPQQIYFIWKYISTSICRMIVPISIFYLEVYFHFDLGVLRQYLEELLPPTTRCLELGIETFLKIKYPELMKKVLASCNNA